MGNRVKLHEAIKISVEIDPKDIEGAHAEPEIQRGPPLRPGIRAGDGGKFESYVRELNSRSHLSPELSEIARSINEAVVNILDSVALREDKRESHAAQHAASGKVLREWRSFLRELSDFERRFK
jgi:hypothetical protein